MTVEDKEWQKVIDLYAEAKSCFILYEETGDHKTNIQVLNEYRSALDHVMQIIVLKLEGGSARTDIKNRFEPLLEHLQRALCDLLDTISINYRNMIIDELAPYSPDTITVAIPKYYSEHRPFIEEISERIIGYRSGKNESIPMENLREYTNDVSELKGIYKQILLSKPGLIEVDRSDKKKKRRTLFITCLGWVIGIISILIAVFK